MSQNSILIGYLRRKNRILVDFKHSWDPPRQTLSKEFDSSKEKPEISS